MGHKLWAVLNDWPLPFLTDLGFLFISQESDWSLSLAILLETKPMIKLIDPQTVCYWIFSRSTVKERQTH